MSKVLYSAEALHVPSIASPETAADLVRAAHEICPYSNATRGNIEVELIANGKLVEAAAQRLRRLVAARAALRSLAELQETLVVQPHHVGEPDALLVLLIDTYDHAGLANRHRDGALR